MTERIRTLVLDSDGGGWKYVAADTVLRGIMGLRSEVALPGPLRRNQILRKVLGQRYESLSYILDWREALEQSPDLDVEFCNPNNLIEYGRFRRALRDYPLVIVLHSAAGDHMGMLLRTMEWFKARRGQLVVFLGNEYDLLDEKIRFVREVEADFLCTQLPLAAAQWLYGECTRTRILPLPHALNPKVYRPDPGVERTVDVGFVGDLYYAFIGDRERTQLIRFFADHAAEHDLACDLRFRRMPRTDWAGFLNGCKAIIGAESGTYYLDDRGRLMAAAKAFVRAHPDTPFEVVYERFFANPPPHVSGKAISSRHFEPIGTKTCQMLLEGEYNGILVADEHYISIKKDLSNIGGAIERFKDADYRQAMVERTYEYTLGQHTYRHRVETLAQAVRD